MNRTRETKGIQLEATKVLSVEHRLLKTYQLRWRRGLVTGWLQVSDVPAQDHCRHGLVRIGSTWHNKTGDGKENRLGSV